MPIPFLLVQAGIAIGKSLLAKSAAKAEFKLNRARINYSAGAAASSRLEEFLQRRGAQRAVFASGGLAGGATRRLFEAQGQLSYLTAQQTANAETRAAISDGRAAYQTAGAAELSGALSSIGGSIASAYGPQISAFASRVGERALNSGINLFSKPAVGVYSRYTPTP